MLASGQLRLCCFLQLAREKVGEQVWFKTRPTHTSMFLSVSRAVPWLQGVSDFLWQAVPQRALKTLRSRVRASAGWSTASQNRRFKCIHFRQFPAAFESS